MVWEVGSVWFGVGGPSVFRWVPAALPHPRAVPRASVRCRPPWRHSQHGFHIPFAKLLEIKEKKTVFSVASETDEAFRGPGGFQA